MFDRQDRAAVRGLAGVSTEVVAPPDGARSARKCCSRIGAERAGDFAGVVLLERRRAVEIDLLPGFDVRRQRYARRARQAARRSANVAGAAVYPRAWRPMVRTAWPVEADGDAERPRNRGIFGERLHAWRVTPAGTAGYEKAEVRRRRGYGGAVVEDFRGAQSAGALLHRRSGGCDRPLGRLQFSMGLGVGILGGSVRLMPSFCQNGIDVGSWFRECCWRGRSALGPAL